ncbi:hypothetical protein [Parasitella parasitica]|uniref:Ubiquitin carboxyl-terminal hydrolase n=1 Tax=Parasitella parasitica TaxID=35722 RepID=A0A0B7NFT0_9FUNG|nr:hypothetical protein [Parasitella parasitica]
MNTEQDTLNSKKSEQELGEKAKDRKIIKWLPLEANPDVWNKILHNNGVNPNWKFTDIYGFDSETLAMIPRPVAAIIFLFPITDAYEEFRKREETHLKAHEQDISAKLIYYKQTISNACGMMALLHSIANNDHLVVGAKHVGSGVFQTILQETRNMSPMERAEYLEKCADLAEIHAISANEGQTETPDITEKLRLHFICFVEVDKDLYELDGRRSFPINHGKCSNFVQSAAEIMTQFVDRNPEEKEYSAIALSQIPSQELKILSPPKNGASIPELPESAYKLDANEIKQLYQSSVERRQNFENRPLKTQKMRDSEDQEKLKKYPKTTIRVRMPDHTIVQAVFQSKEKVFDVYEFLRSLLETPERKFVLCLPPRTKLVEPSITLFKAGLSPASNVLFGWIEKGEKGGKDLKEEYLAMKQDLTSAASPQSQSSTVSTTSTSNSETKSSTSKSIPKWIQKGLFNKK